jgi:hypothetical protein
MKLIVKTFSSFVLGIASLAISGIASATIILTPSTPSVIAGYGYGPSNCEPSCVNTVFGDTSALSLLYKADVGSADSGLFANSYGTLFLNSSSDPSGALLGYTGGPAIDCLSCYLAIKDGNQSPGYYFFDLSAWNGTESIYLSNFWPRQGAISHISIWGTTGASVPEPATLGLLGLGLLGVGLSRRKKKA